MSTPENKKKSGFIAFIRAKNDIPLIFALYAVSFLITVFMFQYKGSALYLLAGIACLGYVAVCILIAFKLIAHFKHGGKDDR